MTSALLDRWGIRPGKNKEERSAYVSEDTDRFLYPDTFEKLYDLLRDQKFAEVASPILIGKIEAICTENNTTLPWLFILNDFELATLTNWDQTLASVITLAAERFRDVQRDSS